MRRFLLVAGAVALAAIAIGLFISMGFGVISLPGMFLSALLNPGQGDRPTVTWSSPTPAQLPTATPSPTIAPTFLPLKTPTKAPPPTPMPTAYVILYSVQPGDTLERIAAKFGVTTEAIRQASRLPPDSTIFLGQVLFISNPKTTPTPVPTAPSRTLAPTGTATP